MSPHPDSPEATAAREAALDRLAEAPEHLRELREIAADLRRLVHSGVAPARMETIVLSVTEPEKRSDVSGDQATRSIGVLNPSPAVVYLGVGGSRAAPGQLAPSVPPGAALTLPVAVADCAVGADPADLAAGDAVVFLFRFATVQPLALAERL